MNHRQKCKSWNNKTGKGLWMGQLLEWVNAKMEKSNTGKKDNMEVRREGVLNYKSLQLFI